MASRPASEAAASLRERVDEVSTTAGGPRPAGAAASLTTVFPEHEVLAFAADSLMFRFMFGNLPPLST